MPATDNYGGSQEPRMPVSNAAVVVPGDAVDLTNVSRAVYVGVTGNLTVRMVTGATVTFIGVPAGALLPIRVDRVLATGTTAASILNLW